MSTDPADDAYAPYLKEIADLSVSLARDLHNRAVEAKDNGEAARLATAFHRVARGLRQTIALAAKLEREATRAAREDRDDGARQQKARVDERRTQLKRTLNRLIYTETETEDACEDLLADLDDLLDVEELTETFLDETLDAQVLRLRAALGLMAQAEGEAFPPLEGRDRPRERPG